MTKDTVDIIVLTYNRISYFKTFVKFLYSRTKYPFRLIVVDNGSIDGTREYILELEKEGLIWKHIFNKENLPLAKALTEGLKLVESELFVTVADDMIPPNTIPCWLEIFVAKMNSDENIGCINMVCSRRSFEIFKQRHDQ
jgi:glycosyltransferase involved in cell wall biosynthesis